MVATDRVLSTMPLAASVVGEEHQLRRAHCNPEGVNEQWPPVKPGEKAKIYKGVPQERLDLASCVLARNCALHPSAATMRHERDALRF